MSGKYEYRDLGGLTRLLRGLLGLGLVMVVVTLASSVMQVELLGRAAVTAEEADANDSRELVVGLVAVPVYLLTVIIFAHWIVRANRNVRALGATGLRTTPGWAVGYFFVPIVNLWRPYQAMEDLWRSSRSPNDWDTSAVAPILRVWWALWVVSNVLSQAAFRTTLRAETVEALRTATLVQIGEQVVDIPLFLVASVLVGEIASAQASHVRSNTGEIVTAEAISPGS